MALLIPFDSGGLDPKVAFALDDIIAAIQVWAGKVDGINAAERLNELTSGIASLPTTKPGTIEMFGGPVANIPTGYLYCDGSAVSRTTYANLFAAVGTTWGAGDGSATFNLPDGRGRYFFGLATSGTGSTLGGTFGTKDHTHTLSGSTANESAHTHSISTSVSATKQVAASPHDHTTPVGNNTTGDDVASNTHTHGAGDTGAGSAHSHGAGTLATAGANPPSFVGIYMIKT